MLKNAKLKSLEQRKKGNGLFACKNCKIWHLKLLICPWGQGQGRDFCKKLRPWVRDPHADRGGGVSTQGQDLNGA